MPQARSGGSRGSGSSAPGARARGRERLGSRAVDRLSFDRLGLDRLGLVELACIALDAGKRTKAKRSTTASLQLHRPRRVPGGTRRRRRTASASSTSRSSMPASSGGDTLTQYEKFSSRARARSSAAPGPATSSGSRAWRRSGQVHPRRDSSLTRPRKTLNSGYQACVAPACGQPTEVEPARRTRTAMARVQRARPRRGRRGRAPGWRRRLRERTEMVDARVPASAGVA